MSVTAATACSMSRSRPATAASGIPCRRASAPAITSSGMIIGMTMLPRPTISTPQMRICTTATDATPRILPSIRSKGRTEETITSSTRLFFSSMTDCMTIAP